MKNRQVASHAEVEKGSFPSKSDQDKDVDSHHHYHTMTLGIITNGLRQEKEMVPRLGMEK